VSNRRTLGLLAAVVVAAAAVAVVVYVRREPPKPPEEEGKKSFREAAEASGIKWRMNFLPGEQGEKYKINLYDHGCGLAVGDFDGDGFDDIYFVNQLGKNALYRNKGDGTFEDVTDKAGVGLGDRVCVAATFVDYDNDGHQDLFVTSIRGGNVLFHNEGNGTFKDVTKEAGLAHVGHAQGGFFFDFDGDGKLDLLVLYTGSWTSDQLDPDARYHPGVESLEQLARCPKEYNVLYRNLGNGKFEDVTEKSGLKGQGWAADAAVFDYDGDGKLDVLITNMFGRSQLYRNNGNGTFTDVTLAVLGKTPAGGMGAKAFDIDNDGRLDLYIVDMHSDMWIYTGDDPATFDEKKKHRYMFVPEFAESTESQMAFEKKITDLIGLKYNEVVFGNTLHRNLGGGKFEEISDKAGVETIWPWGIADGDFDNDGYVDVFIPSGMGYPFRPWPNRLLMNRGDRTFAERSKELGVEPPPGGIFLGERIRGRPMPKSSRAAAVADFDNDGRLDLVVNNFNDLPYYFRNEFPRRNYVAFRLTGTASNRDAIGAVVRLHAGGQVLTRLVSPAGGYLTQGSKVVHFGLGDRKPERVEITWPGGKVQVLEGPELNKRHDVTEPAK
jgi:hypothetical protein